MKHSGSTKKGLNIRENLVYIRLMEKKEPLLIYTLVLGSSFDIYVILTH